MPRGRNGLPLGELGHVACVTEMLDGATLNVLVDDALKKMTEGLHNTFRFTLSAMSVSRMSLPSTQKTNI